MITLTRLARDPWTMFDDLYSWQRDFNRLLQGTPRRAWGRSFPRMNVWGNDNEVVVDAQVAGIEPKDIDVSVQDDVLTISGEVAGTVVAEGETLHRQERPYGSFSRSVQLPFRANANDVKANCRNGVLRIVVPRSEEDKPKRISVETA